MYGAFIEHSHYLTNKFLRNKISIWQYLCADKLHHLKINYMYLYWFSEY